MGDSVFLPKGKNPLSAFELPFLTIVPPLPCPGVWLFSPCVRRQSTGMCPRPRRVAAAQSGLGLDDARSSLVEQVIELRSDGDALNPPWHPLFWEKAQEGMWNVPR